MPECPEAAVEIRGTLLCMMLVWDARSKKERGVYDNDKMNEMIV